MKIEHSTDRRNEIVFFIDADNTLWDTDAVFAMAQEKLLSGVEQALGLSAKESDRLAFVRQIDQSLAEIHHLGLRYPPSLLAQALALAIVKGCSSGVAEETWRNLSSRPLHAEVANKLAQHFFSDLKETPTLNAGVHSGLVAIKNCGATIIIVTEGQKNRVKMTAKSLGIAEFADRIIEGKKRKEFFSRLIGSLGHPMHVFMIGDQLSRDIRPAKAAGITTVYVPGAFVPRWEFQEGLGEVDVAAQSFDHAVKLALRFLQSKNV